MVLYTLSMSHDDCGGSFEYAHFYHKLRQVLGVPSAKEEIRKSVGDILSFVESEYQEEEKKLRRRELTDRRIDGETKKEQDPAEGKEEEGVGGGHGGHLRRGASHPPDIGLLRDELGRRSRLFMVGDCRLHDGVVGAPVGLPGAHVAGAIVSGRRGSGWSAVATGDVAGN